MTYNCVGASCSTISYAMHVCVSPCAHIMATENKLDTAFQFINVASANY